MVKSEQNEPGENGGERFLADIAALTIAGYLVQPIMFVSSLFTRRILGPFLAGTFATLGLVQQYTQLLNLGVLQAAERQLPYFRGSNDLERCRRIRVTSLTLALFSGVVTAAGTLAYALLARGHLPPPLFRGLIIYSAIALFTQWSLSYLAFLRSDQQFQYLARNNVLFMMLTAAGNVACTYFFGFEGLLAWTAIITVLGCIAYTRFAGLVRPQLSAEVGREAKLLVASGIPLLLVSFSHMGVHTMDNVMVLKLLGTEALGMYTLALSAGNVIYSFANSVSQVLYPRVQEEHGRTSDSAVVLRFLGRPTQLLASVLPLFVAPLFFFLPVVVRAFVPKFVPGLPAFRVILAGISLYALIQIPRLCLISLGRMRHLIAWSLVTMAVCVGTSYPLSRFGLVGVAFSACLAYFVGFTGPTAHVLWRRHTLPSIVGLIARAIVPTLYCGMIFWGIEEIWPEGSSSMLLNAVHGAAKMLMFMAAYVPMLWMFESHTGLARNYVLPAWRRLIARVARRAPTGSP